MSAVLQREAQSLPQGFVVTSAISGPHVRNSAHFAGKAIDVGGPVGLNNASYGLIVSAVQSGKYRKIGTTPELVQYLGPWAKSQGVEMFVDEGTGPHIHLEVP